MFKFFSKKESALPQLLVSDLHTKKTGYPKIVEDIHNEFNIAGENLLKEAKDIIANIRIENEGKVDDLKSCGFSSTKEVVHTEAERNKKAKKEELANALEYFNVHYPMYKFITQDMALKICKKYNLVLGDVGQFTGFVPEKNLKQIKRFFENENKLSMQYYEWYRGMFHSRTISKESYDKAKEQEQKMNEMMERVGHTIPYHVRYGARKTELKIAAPIKDMKKDGYKLLGKVFVKEVPDPVVLAPVKHGNIELYCIVTAWGDEASDEIVVNQTQN